MGSERCGDLVSSGWIPTQSDLDEMDIGCLKECNEGLKLWDGQRYIWIIDATGMRGSFSQPLLFCASAIFYPTACQLFTQTAIWFLICSPPSPSSDPVSQIPGKALIWPPWTNQEWSRQQNPIRTRQITHITWVRLRVREEENNFPKEGGYMFPEVKGKKKPYHSPTLPRREANKAFK